MNLKKSAQTVFVLIAVIWLSDNAYSQTFLTNGLVAYFPFNGNANDLSGNGNNGIVNAATLTVDRLGQSNSAYAFDGVSSFITVPDSPSLRVTNDITVTCWVKFSDINAQVRVLGKGGSCYKNYGLWYDPHGTDWLFQQFPPEGGCVGCQENTASATPILVLDRWYQMVGVRSGNVTRLYVNGAQVQQSSVCSSNTYTGSESLIIGATDPATELMHGSLDDIRIYNRAFSSYEVAQLYAIETAPRVDLIKAVKPSFLGLMLGTNYQLQISSDLNNWTNQGAVFTATNSAMIYPQYFDADNWGKLFFRLQVSP